MAKDPRASPLTKQTLGTVLCKTELGAFLDASFSADWRVKDSQEALRLSNFPNKHVDQGGTTELRCSCKRDPWWSERA